MKGDDEMHKLWNPACYPAGSYIHLMVSRAAVAHSSKEHRVTRSKATAHGGPPSACPGIR